MLDEIYRDLGERMDKTVEALESEYKKLRTGRASISLVDGIRADYYGSATPLSQLATLTIPDPRTIVIQPWDTSVAGEIEKAILKSDLGLTPMNDGKTIRIGIPPLTAERRRDLVKVVKKRAEESKVAVRNIRRDINEKIKDLKKDKKVSEDEQFRAQEEIQRVTGDYVKRIDAVCLTKEKEVLET
ncbi:MAG TPA: ribosome recycling factor [Syntrophobacteraceae bacterium]|nr:ribosome recycling factor [Syntrophobacteraceae bacterium]